MHRSQPFLRSLFFIFLLTCLLTGLAGVVDVPVSAASSNIVISQIYGGGGNSGAPYTNDYVELFNLGSTTVSISGWSIQYASATSTSWSATNLSGSIAPGQYYLVQLAGGANGSALPTPDLTGSLNLSSTDGKVALVNTTTALTGSGCPFSASVIDFVGYGTADCSETASAPSPSSTTVDGRTNICTDTDNNSLEFSTDTPNPHNTSVLPTPCLRVINVDSSKTNGAYPVGEVIAIQVTFSNTVVVDVANGSPTLALETGTADTPATYTGGSGTSTLTFNYVVAAGDTSGDLDYVAVNSLALNGATITGAIGNANLTLPTPGTTGSLGANKDIRIDNGNGVAPNILSFSRQPASSLPTNANSLTFRVTFNEAVIGVDAGDFIVTGTTATPTSIILISSGIYDVTVSGGNLNNLNGIVGLNLINTTHNITDAVLNALPNGEPPIDETYVVDNTPPSVTSFNRSAGQVASTSVLPINYDVVFSEPINASTFTAGDITLTGTATFATWNIVDSGDHQNFSVSATTVSPNGTVIPGIAVNRVGDLAGNLNTTAIVGQTVTFADTTAPTVTVDQTTAPTLQPDPTAFFPINFTVVFSEPINVSTFTTSDITQTGTAVGVTWSISNSGDNMTFIVAATSATSNGTIQPIIAANRVTDLVGNNNSASTSTVDNTVFYETDRPSVTVEQSIGQADPTSDLPINFTVAFSEPINVSTFTSADITQSGTATGITWDIVNTDAGVNKVFTLSAIALTGNGTLIPSIGVNRVTDVAGNNNYPSTVGTSNDNTVTSKIVIPPTPLPTATAVPILNIVISEVAWMGTSSSTSSDEWVELYNSSLTTVDLSNWTLKSTDGSISITFLPTDTNHMIAPGQFFILAPSGTFSDVTINKTISTAFNDSGKSLELRNNLGVLIDTANSNGGPWPAGKASPTYATMERHGLTSLDSDVNWYTFAGTQNDGTQKKHDRNGNLVKGTPGYANWAVSVIATPSPVPTSTRAPTKTATVAPAAPPPLLAINEFVPRPGHDWNNDGVVNTGDEYIELLNHGVIDVNLSGYKLDDEANVGSPVYNLPSNITLKPGERYVFYGSQTGLLLGDGGDGVRLIKSNGQLMDAYNYSIVEFPDQSYCRLPDDGGADDWNTHCYPTPGLKNSLSGTVLRPPTQNNEDQPLCPIADTLPEGFVLAECSPFGNNIWSRYYWDKFGWYGDKPLFNINGKWDVYAD